jgi:hypothetical protein
VRSPAIFNATDTCRYAATNCSADAFGTCHETPDDWVEYDFLAARLWSDGFVHESTWPQNPDIKIHSGASGVAQWTRHRWWGWSSAPGSHPVCYGAAYLVGLFNGVWSSEAAGQNGVGAMKSESFLGVRHRGAPIRYRLFYNQTGCSSGGMACLEDLTETFIQRSAELDAVLARRWELFWEQVTGSATATHSFTGLLSSRLVAGADAFLAWRNALSDAFQGRMTALLARLLANPPATTETATHVSDLVGQGQLGYRSVLVGHSQGNLFANAAYEGYLAHAREAGVAAGHDTGYVAASIVHVAPASAVLRGPHVLAEIDVVINGMRGLDSSPVAPNTLRRDVMQPSLTDPSGHRFVQTYLDEERPARAEIRRLIVAALDGL